MMNGKKETEKRIPLEVGAVATMQRKILESDIVQMADLSGDHNPIHLDEEYAKTTRFGKRIAHGLFCTAMISALLGNELPGLGTVIMSETMRFLAPVYIGDTILAQVKVESINPEKRRAELSFECRNQDDRQLMTGTVKVMV